MALGREWHRMPAVGMVSSMEDESKQKGSEELLAVKSMAREHRHNLFLFVDFYAHLWAPRCLLNS